MTATASCEGRSYRPGLIPELHNVGGVAGGGARRRLCCEACGDDVYERNVEMDAQSQ